MIRDQLIFEKNPNFLQSKCFACNSKNHFVLDCPLLHYIPNKIKIVRCFILNPGQNTRKPFERSRTKSNKLNSLFSVKYVQKCNERFRTFSNFFLGMEGSTYFESEDYDNLEDKPPRKRLIINTNIEKMIESPLMVHQKNFTDEAVPSEIFEKNFIKSAESPNIKSIVIHEQPDLEAFYENEQNSLKLQQRVSSFQENEMAQSPNIKLNQSMEEQILFRGGSRNPFDYPPRNSISIKRQNPRNSVSEKPLLKMIPVEPDSAKNSDQLRKFQQFYSRNEEDLEKYFEKGCNFKNFYPEKNLNRILEFNKQIRKKNKEIRCLNKKAPIYRSFKRLKPVKSNKIMPSMTIENMDNLNIYKKNESFTSGRRSGKKTSSIYYKDPEKKFTNMKNLTFYDVVNEVLNNLDLKKKLLAQKNIKKKNNDF